MSSQNKKKKLKNSGLVPSGLKDKNPCKRINFYNSGLRNKIKNETKKEMKKYE